MGLSFSMTTLVMDCNLEAIKCMRRERGAKSKTLYQQV